MAIPGLDLAGDLSTAGGGVNKSLRVLTVEVKVSMLAMFLIRTLHKKLRAF